MSDRKTNITIFIVVLVVFLGLWCLFRKDPTQTASIQQAITATDSAKKDVRINAGELQSVRTRSDSYTKEQKAAAVKSVPASDDIDALVALANDIIRRGREDRLTDSADVRKRPVGTLSTEGRVQSGE